MTIILCAVRGCVGRYEEVQKRDMMVEELHEKVRSQASFPGDELAAMDELDSCEGSPPRSPNPNIHLVCPLALAPVLRRL